VDYAHGTLKTSPSLLLIIALSASFLGGTVVSAKSDKGKGNSEEKNEGRGQSADFIPPGHRRAPVEVVVKQAPPAVRIEVQSARPSPAHIWVPGYWTWEVSAYVWTPSVWVLPPEPTAVWVQPRYEPRSGINIYISGFWRL
jgi:hypothetical protein